MVKLDQGYKPVLRGSRKAFKAIFTSYIKRNQLGNHHRWEVDEWLEQVKAFLIKHIGIAKPTKKEVCAAVVLIYHAFGETDSYKADSVI
jgi:hypothetical protein